MEFLYGSYEARFYWFEVLELIRKLCQASLVVFFMEGTASQIVISMLISLSSCAILMKTSPYINDSDDTLALLAQFDLFMALFATLLLKVNVDNEDGYSQAAFGYVMTFFLLSVPLRTLGLFLYEYMPDHGLPCLKKKGSVMPTENEVNAVKPTFKFFVHDQPNEG